MLLFPSKPAGISLSPYCSNKCIFCNPLGHQRVTDLELKKQEIKVYKNLIEHKKKWHISLEITGHDPLEYLKIVSLIKYIKRDLLFKYVVISTNGVRLADDLFLDEFIKSGIDCLRIPLYGSNAKIHDSITQVKGSFDNVIKGIKKLKEKAPNIKLWLTSLIMQQNKEDLKNILDLVISLKADKFYFSVPCLSNSDSSYYVPFKELSNYLKPIKGPNLKNDLAIEFWDIPYCIFGNYSNLIKFSTPPDLGAYNQPSSQFKSEIKDVPTYRLKTKVQICGECVFSKSCSGFYINDVKKYGYGNLKPIQSI